MGRLVLIMMFHERTRSIDQRFRVAMELFKNISGGEKYILGMKKTLLSGSKLITFY